MKGKKKLMILAMAFSILGGTAAYGAEESVKLEETAAVEEAVQTAVEEAVTETEQALLEETSAEAIAEEQKEENGAEKIDHEALAKEYIPVLMYHHFKDDNTIPDGDGMLTTKDDLEEQLQYFIEQGYRIISLERLEYMMNHAERDVSLTGKGMGLDRKCLCITIDDGYYSNYEIAYPLFQKYHVPASVFAITDFVTEQYGVKKFTWSQAWDMDRRGWLKVYSHTPKHVPVEEGKEREFLLDLRSSQETLKEKLKRNYHVKTMSYPNGRYTEESQRMLTEDGFEMQFTIENGVITRETPRNALPRITVKSGMSGADIVRIIEEAAEKEFAVENTENTNTSESEGTIK